MTFQTEIGSREWEYISGTFDNSIGQNRINHFNALDELSGNNLLLALRDPETDKWTKHLPMQKILHLPTKYDALRVWGEPLRSAYDIHRSQLWNEIVLETDYPEYEENYQLAQKTGAILEDKGFIIHYYFSGSKSIHMHIYIDFKDLLRIDIGLQDLLINEFTEKVFKSEFITFLRKKMSTAWGLNTALGFKMDEQVSVSSKHLIRAELSKNKKGYKTFLGYSYKDLSFVPYICNPDTKFYPRIGEIKLSALKDPQELVEEFLRSRSDGKKKQKLVQKSASLYNWFNPSEVTTTDLKKCVNFILSKDFKPTDGYRRALFILANDIGSLYGKDVALDRIRSWNAEIGSPIKDSDIVYQCSRPKHYSLTHNYIHEYLESIGFKFEDYHGTH